MDQKINDIRPSAGDHEELERLMDQGRQMHNQATFDLLARLVSGIAHIVKRNLGDPVGEQSTADQFGGAYRTQSSKYPA